MNINHKVVLVDVSLLKLETRNSGNPAWFPGSNLKLETGCLCSGTVVGGRPIEALSNFARLGIWILVQLKSKSSSLSSKISEMEVAPRYKLLEHFIHTVYAALHWLHWLHCFHYLHCLKTAFTVVCMPTYNFKWLGPVHKWRHHTLSWIIVNLTEFLLIPRVSLQHGLSFGLSAWVF